MYARKRSWSREPMPGTVVFQPVWGTDARSLAEWVLKDRLDVRVMLQEHKFLWGELPAISRWRRRPRSAEL